MWATAENQDFIFTAINFRQPLLSNHHKPLLYFFVMIL